MQDSCKRSKKAATPLSEGSVEIDRYGSQLQEFVSIESKRLRSAVMIPPLFVNSKSSSEAAPLQSFADCVSRRKV